MKNFLKSSKIIIFLTFISLSLSNSYSGVINFDQFYNQTLLENDIYFYTISTSNKNITNLFIDIIIYGGDVEVNITSSIPDAEITKTISVNHIIIKINKIQYVLANLTFFVKARSNSFYLLFADCEENTKSRIESLMTEKLQTGFSYLINVNPHKRDFNNEFKTIIKFNSQKFNAQKPIMTTFFILNCEIDVNQIYIDEEEKKNKVIKKYGNLFFDLVKPGETKYYNSSLEYKIKMIERDPTDYEGNLCQLFASSVEISDDNINDIIVPDNNPQQVMFSNDVKNVSYGYMHLDLKKGLMIKFYPKHIAQYTIRLYFDKTIEREKKETIIGRNVIFLTPEELSHNCKNNNISCYIRLNIVLENIKDNENPVLEFSFQMAGSNSVSYIPKRVLKTDFLLNNHSQNFYTELAYNEEGFITVNFLRGIGKVFFKIVDEEVPEENGDWRGKYSFLNNSQELFYSKKKSEIHTVGKNCEKGCYLLISIFSDFNNENQIDVNFPFSIMINTYPKYIFEFFNDDIMPIINIQNDEYVVGAVNHISSEEIILEFYSILLNSNAKQVLIDFQSDTASLYINVGNKKPSTDKCDFKFEPKGIDSIFIIQREKILEEWKKNKGNEDFTGLKGIILTLGIKTKTNNINSQNLFGFVVRLMNNTENDIYRVNSDRKALCKPKMISKDKYRCVYSIDNYYLNSKNCLLVYPIPQNKSALIKIYGKYINQADYELLPDSKLNNLIPKEGNAIISNQDYLLIKEGFGNFLVTVESDIDTTIELLSSIYFYQSSIHIDDYEPKVFFGFKNQKLNIDLPKLDYLDYMVNLRSIEGSADIYWDIDEGNKYFLEGKDDRISINTEVSKRILTFSPKGNIKENIGIIFYLNIQPRIYECNFDELILDSSSNYFYSGNDLPINYFAPIPKSFLDNDEYYEIFFSFEYFESNTKIKKYYEKMPFSIDSNIVEYDIILSAKNQPEVTVQPSNNIKGHYDPLLKTGYIKIKKSNINGPYVRNDRPYLFLVINKYGENEEYNRFSLEVTATKNEPESPISESSYQFGKLEKNQKERIYKLRADNSFKYMFIKFSCSNNNALSIEIGGKNLIKKVTEYGRSIFSVEIEKTDLMLYLKIKRANNKETEEFFTFQYMHGNNDDIIKAYKIIQSSKLNITKIPIDKKNKENKEEIQRNNVSISLNPVEKYENYNITYLIRGIDISTNNNYNIKKEDLSLKFFQKQYYLEYINPKVNENKRLIFNLDNITENVKFIQIIAQIRDNRKERLEYLSYDIYSEVDDDDDDDKKSKLFIIVISFGAFILIVVIILIVIVITYRYKNKGLIDKINKTSFSLDRDSVAQSESSEDLLLGKEYRH